MEQEIDTGSLLAEPEPQGAVAYLAHHRNGDTTLHKASDFHLIYRDTVERFERLFAAPPAQPEPMSDAVESLTWEQAIRERDEARAEASEALEERHIALTLRDRAAAERDALAGALRSIRITAADIRRSNPLAREVYRVATEALGLKEGDPL